jgi:ubiquinone/menaquinone biosynthesis C-methylase UbiE
MSDARTHGVSADGAAYENYVGRWSRLVADDFLRWIDVPPGKAWLDVGCGTGVLTRKILERSAPAQVLGVDASERFVSHARAHIAHAHAAFRVGDARALPAADEEFDAAVSGLVLNFVSDPAKAIAEMRRATRAGGTIAVYVWDYSGEMQMMRRFWDAAAALDPAAEKLDESLRFPICRPDALRALFAKAGLRDIDTMAIDIPTIFRNFDDYWSPFLGGQGPAPAYCMSLPEPARIALRDRLKASLNADPDGRIRLMARAFAVKGVA